MKWRLAGLMIILVAVIAALLWTWEAHEEPGATPPRAPVAPPLGPAQLATDEEEASSAEPDSGRVTGRVIEAERLDGVGGVIVWLEPEDESAEPLAARTDAEGRFVIADIAPGAYAFYCEPPRGYAVHESLWPAVFRDPLVR